MHDFLSEKLRVTYTKEKVNEILEGLACKRKTTFRVNDLKSSVEEVENELTDKCIKYEKLDKFESFNNVFILDANSENLLSSLNIYKEGKIYLQSISSMLPIYILEPKANENILDMCAAPGGKTTLIAALTNNKVNLTAVELHKDRFERLKYNVSLQGANAYLLNINAIDLDNNLKFDKILFDAPCSGSGILNINDYKYQKYFTSALIEKCVKTQRKLLSKASKILNKGGVLVYSTCSLLKEENEDLIDFAISKGFRVDEIFLQDIVKKLGIDKLNKDVVIEKNYIKTFPNEIFEGFFVTRLVKE